MDFRMDDEGKMEQVELAEGLVQDWPPIDDGVRCTECLGCFVR